jgi:hypothetical protein
MTPLETLKAARDLISDPARWTQGTYARNEIGARTRDFEDASVSFSALGALRRVHMPPSAVALLVKQLPEGIENIDAFNDTHTHAEVIALFDAAIAELEGANVA